jgi:hypothetical protein
MNQLHDNRLSSYPESPYKAPLRKAQDLNYLLAVIVLIALGLTAAAMFTGNVNC